VAPPNFKYVLPWLDINRLPFTKTLRDLRNQNQDSGRPHYLTFLR
jgi:hypothetical protein